MIFFVLYYMIITVFWVSFIVSIGVYLSWRYSKMKDYKHVVMKYNQWKQLYNLNPHRYIIGKSYYWEDQICIHWNKGCTDIYILFNYFGWIKFRLFLIKKHFNDKKKERLDIDSKSNKALKEILKVAKEDIDSIRVQAKQQIKESSERYVKTCGSILKENKL